MAPDIKRRSHAVFSAALEFDEPERRRAFVEETCASDAELLRKVLDLLNAVQNTTTFLESPALGNSREFVTAATRMPSSIGSYRIVRVLGIGGMAAVYEAMQESPSRRVALKVMRQGLTGTSGVQRFRFETEVLAKLQHPGIAQIFEVGATHAQDGMATPYFAMEFIPDALPITVYAKEHSLPLAESLEMLAEVCDAVHHGHLLGVVHRDLKPGNVLVDATGRARVIDFGVARSLDPSLPSVTQQTEVGQIVGTLNYMSPEQCSGGVIDIRTDIYSLGVVLYELVCGRTPFSLADLPLPQAARVISEESPPRPSTLNPAARGDVDAIILKAMEKDAGRRYQSAAALAADLRRHLAHEAIEARPPTAIRQLTLFSRRHRSLVGGVAGAFLAVCLGTAVSLNFAYQKSVESKGRRAAEERAIQERDRALWKAYIANVSAACSALSVGETELAQSRLAESDPALRGWEWRYLDGDTDPAIRTIPAHEDLLEAMAVSPEGDRLVTASLDGTLRMWSTETGSLLAESPRSDSERYSSVAFTCDGAYFVSGAENGTVQMWDGRTAQPVCTIGRHDGEVHSIACAPTGEIVSASLDGKAFVWAADAAGEPRVLDDQLGGIDGVVISRTTGTWVTWNKDGVIRIRAPGGGPPFTELTCVHSLECAAISPDGASVAVGGAEGRVTVWDVRKARIALLMQTPQSRSLVRVMTYTPSGKTLIFGQGDRTITLVDAVSTTLVGQLDGHREAITGLWVTPDEKRLFSTSWDRTIRVWGLDESHPTGSTVWVKGHEDQVLTTCFTPDNSMLVSGGRDDLVRLSDPIIGETIGVLRGHTGDVFSVACSPDGSLIASGSMDDTVRIWNARTGAVEAVLTGHDDGVWAVCFHPDGRRLVSSGDDRTIREWDLGTGQIVKTLRGHTNRVNNVRYSPDGRLIASGSRDHSVRLWDAETGELIRTFTGHTSDVFSVAFSPDSRVLYSGSRDQSVRAWDVASGASLGVLDGHGQFITSIAVSPDGKRLAAGSWFRQVLLWDLRTQDLVLAFEAHGQPIRAVAWSPSGQKLATASADRTVSVLTGTSRAEYVRSRADALLHRAAAEKILERLERENSGGDDLQRLLGEDSVIDKGVVEWVRKLLLARSLGQTTESERH